MRWLALAVYLMAAGCAQQRQAEALAKAEDNRAQVEKSCNVLYPSQIGYYVARTQCVEPAVRRLYRAHGVPDDFSNLLLAQRMAIAGQMDRREITPEEGQRRYAEVRSNIIEHLQQRFNAAATASPPPHISPAPVVIQQPAAPVYVAPRQARCTQIGNTVSCTDY